MRYATYRILYGEDFIQESIKSIEPYVDKIFVFWTNKVLGGITEVTYKNEKIVFPNKFDNVIEKIRELNLDKIILIEDYVENNINQFTHLVNDYILPNYDKPKQILFLEPDHVFKQMQLEKFITLFEESDLMNSSCYQIELWKTPQYKIRFRQRTSSVLWNLSNLKEIPLTRRQADHKDMKFINAYVHNMGFCISEKNMYWKHLLALAFSSKIEDSVPNENWYEKTWLNWDFQNNNKNLEIAKGYESLIPNAIRYNTYELPQLIKNRYNL